MNHCPFRNCTLRRYRHRPVAELQLAESWPSRVAPLSALVHFVRLVSRRRGFIYDSQSSNGNFYRGLVERKIPPTGAADRFNELIIFIFSFDASAFLRSARGAPNAGLRSRISRNAEFHEKRDQNDISNSIAFFHVPSTMKTNRKTNVRCKLRVAINDICCSFVVSLCSRNACSELQTSATGRLRRRRDLGQKMKRK